MLNVKAAESLCALLDAPLMFLEKGCFLRGIRKNKGCKETPEVVIYDNHNGYALCYSCATCLLEVSSNYRRIL